MREKAASHMGESSDLDGILQHREMVVIYLQEQRQLNLVRLRGIDDQGIDATNKTLFNSRRYAWYFGHASFSYCIVNLADTVGISFMLRILASLHRSHSLELTLKQTDSLFLDSRGALYE